MNDNRAGLIVEILVLILISTIVFFTKTDYKKTLKDTKAYFTSVRANGDLDHAHEQGK